jgi:hypothetical protein
MMATVNINFKFIGGSSMAGPVSRLQNALQHNFFANTELYQRFENNSNKYIKNSNESITQKEMELLPSIPNQSVAQDPPSPLRPISKEQDLTEERLIESKSDSKITQGTKQVRRF